MRTPHSPHILTVLATCLLCFLLLDPCVTADAPKTLPRFLPRSLHRPQQNNGGDNAVASAFNYINYRRLRTRDLPSPASARSAIPLDRCEGGPTASPICDPSNYVQQQKQHQQPQPQHPSSTTSTSNAIAPVNEPHRLGGDAGSDVGRKMMRRTWTKRGSGEALADNQEVSKRYVSKSEGVGSHFQKEDVQGR
ncbi:hypothetical protein MVEG_04590 [Podila verticillata NRRL 6337]|nr:hypothetical protein MVEG_04590 [Podila verticillata NRRL 6337]